MIDEVVRSLKSGKETTVYLVRSGAPTQCAKVYRDMRKRSFQKRARYQEGRKVHGFRFLVKSIDRILSGNSW